MASSIEPTPVIYEQGGLCYNKEVSEGLILNFTNVDNSPETSTATTNVDVFVQEETCSCVTGVREFGANIPKGNAVDLPTGHPPTVGGVVKLKYGEGIEGHHVAYILAILKTGLFVQEKNYLPDCEYSERFISFDDPHIVGFWAEVL